MLRFAIPIALVTTGLLCAVASLREEGGNRDPKAEGLAAMYHMRCELSDFCSDMYNIEMIAPEGEPSNEGVLPRSETGVPVTEIKIRFAITDNKFIQTEMSGRSHPEDSLSFGSFHAPRERCSEHEVAYRLSRDSNGYYVANGRDDSLILRGLSNQDEFQAMLEAKTLVRTSIFPAALTELVRSAQNAE